VALYIKSPRSTSIALLLCSIVAVSLFLLIEPGVAQAKPSSWTYIPAPREGNSMFNGVWCVSSADCVAVGFYLGKLPWNPLIESWNGTSWSIDGSPPIEGILDGISCVNANDCVAVGETISTRTDLALIETWNGKTWNVAAGPYSGISSTLQGVSCVKGECFAVGIEQTKKSGGGLVEVRVHGKWSRVKDPAATGVTLNGISCISTVDCMAAGGTGESYSPFAETWNGSDWSVTSTVPQKYNSVFAGVSCVSSENCFAAGYYDTRENPEHGTPLTLIEQWNGTSWTLVNGQNAVRDATFASISCINANQCAAVGTDDASASPLIELWDGRTWSIATAEVPPGSEGIFGFSSISCVTNEASCTAAGSYNSNRPLVEIGNIPAPRRS
jgi:hypothetical protein